MNIFKFFTKRKENVSKVQNLPDLIRKINRNEIAEYKSKISLQETKKDPLYMRIKVDEFDYINEYNKELSFIRKFLIHPIKRQLSKKINFIRFEKEIYRPNVDLRVKHFNVKPETFKTSYVYFFMLMIFFSYLLGYVWSRLKYDIYTRRFMYTFLFNYMMVFEYLDYHIGRILDKINEIIPREMSDKELEFLLYRKMRTYFIKRKLKGKVEEILSTDPELFEIENLLKRINK